jgi:hypothetical protein
VDTQRMVKAVSFMRYPVTLTYDSTAGDSERWLAVTGSPRLAAAGGRAAGPRRQERAVQPSRETERGDLIEITHLYAGALPGLRGRVERSWRAPNGTRWARVCFGHNQTGQALRSTIPTMQMQRVGEG